MKSGLPLNSLDRPAIDPASTDTMNTVFSLETALAARSNPGAPSVANVKREIESWKACL